jgi:uncharacterized protein (TIGR04255 family)
MGMSESLRLLDFDRPPLGEVALLAQFVPLLQMRNFDFIDLWSRSEFFKSYPDVQEYAELPDFYERFDAPTGGGYTQAGHEVIRGRPVARYNFRNEEQKEQIQIQRSRIGFYWQSGKTYPRFPYVLDRFKRDYSIFDYFVRERKWGGVVPNQCAISYSNRIAKGEGWEKREDLERVVTFWRPDTSQALQPGMTLEDFGNVLAFKIFDDDKPVARMYVTASIREADGENPEVIQLDLIFRGPPAAPDLSGVMKFFEMGHRYIVTTFKAVTTKTMHELWGEQ